MSDTDLRVVDYPDPPAMKVPCPTCAGRGVTGQQHILATETGPPLLVAVFCPSCGGCGNGDPDHVDCDPRLHAFDEYDHAGTDDDEYDAAYCGSCMDRGWWAMEAFSEDTKRMLILRMPCGCTEDRVRLVVREDVEA